ncbi:MAG: hypothetical protein ABJM11_07825 [Marinobacter sp.]|uniref:oxidoreductase n=1 Tax=Marinobacter sp. TaxID=50741 RepID=UPI0032988BC7
MQTPNPRYPHLFSPFRVGTRTVKNRFLFPALTTNFGAADGSVTDELCTYFRMRAEGGFGLLVSENLGVHPSGRVMPNMVMAESDSRIQGLRNLAKAGQQNGAVVFAQLSHAGRQTRSKITGMSLVAPSAIPCPLNREMPRELKIDEISELEQAYIDAAARAAEAGFDGVEVHAAHGYLVAAFLSAYSNHRQDHYGGSLDNRLRFLLNIVDGIKYRLGRSFPVMVRISAEEFVDDGLTIAESIRIASVLAEHKIDVLSVSVGVYESFNRLSMVSGEPEGQWLHIAGAVRRAGVLPVVGVGRIKRAEVAESALADGLIDLAAFGRAGMADPDLPRKVFEGKEGEIISCMGCNLCLGRTARPKSICPINPAIGREVQFLFKKQAKAQRIAFFGGGYATLTAAWVAASRGHNVSVHGAKNLLGGCWHYRSQVPGQEEIAETTAAIIRRAELAGVVFDESPPVAADCDQVWATRTYAPSKLPDRDTGIPTDTVLNVLAEPKNPAGAGRVVVIGDDLCSAETAIKLANDGAQVSLLSTGRDLAVDAHPGFREVSRRRLASLGGSIKTGVSSPYETPCIAEAERLVVGRGADASYEDSRHWQTMPVQIDVTGWISDAYEPGLLAQGVYEAVEFALNIEEYGTRSSD